MKLSEFLQTLNQTQLLGKWYIHSNGALRIQHGECTFCPITAAHYLRSGEIVPIDNYRDAVIAMQLDPALIGPLVTAADGNVNESNELLRYALLQATRGTF